MSWLSAKECFDKLKVGDKVRIKYNKHKGYENEEPGKVVTKTGEVTKLIDALGGGVYINVNLGASREQDLKLHVVEGGTVTGNNPHGNRTVRQGLNGKVKKLN